MMPEAFHAKAIVQVLRLVEGYETFCGRNVGPLAARSGREMESFGKLGRTDFIIT